MIVYNVNSRGPNRILTSWKCPRQLSFVLWHAVWQCEHQLGCSCQWVPDRWEIPFLKYREHLTFPDLRCHVCSGNTRGKALPPTVDSRVADPETLMIIMTRRLLSVVTGKRHWFKDHSYSVQEVSSEFFRFHCIYRSRTHQASLLTPWHRAGRLDWTRDVVNWNVQDWQRLACSGVSWFHCLGVLWGSCMVHTP